VLKNIYVIRPRIYSMNNKSQFKAIAPAFTQTPAERYEWALAYLKKNNVFLTRQRRRILNVLAKRRVPVPMGTLAGELRNICDLATIYRAMRCFQKIGIVRQVNLLARSASFVLAAPHENCDYLICKYCGTINDLPGTQVVLKLEKQIVTRFGFQALQHRFEFYGICPDCQDNHPVVKNL